MCNDQKNVLFQLMWFDLKNSKYFLFYRKKLKSVLWFRTFPYIVKCWYEIQEQKEVLVWYTGTYWPILSTGSQHIQISFNYFVISTMHLNACIKWIQEVRGICV
jgi:hypothetical protein